jgi:hypothetical protein
MALDLVPAELWMVRVVGLLAQVQVDQEWLDLGIITGRQTLDVESAHPLPMLA